MLKILGFRNIFLFITINVLLIISCVPHAAAQETEAKLSFSSDSVSPGRRVKLSLTIEGVPGLFPPVIPYIEGLDIKHLTTEEKNGKVTYIYSVVAFSEGTYKIGPLTFLMEGRTYLSDVATLNVAKGLRAKNIGSGKTDLSGRMFLEVELPEREIFVNEEVPVKVKFYTDWLDVTDLEISDVPSKNYITEDYVRVPPSIEERDGIKYAVIEFHKKFFVSEPGDFVFGPVTARFDIIKATGMTLNPNKEFYAEYLGRRQKRREEFETGPFEITVVPLPAENRPPGFKGTVGRFDMTIAANKQKLTEGQEITLTITITGKGNMRTLSFPDLGLSSKFSTSAPDTERIKNGIIITQKITPISPDPQEIPPAKFSFFDPLSGEYRTVSTKSIPIEVTAVEKTGESSREEISPRDLLITLKEEPGQMEQPDKYFYRRKWFIVFEAMPLLLVPVAAFIKWRFKVTAPDTSYGRRLRASKEAAQDLARIKKHFRKKGHEGFYDIVFRTIQTYLGLRFGVDPGGITEEKAENMLIGKVKDAGILDDISNLYSECYRARFARIDVAQRDKHDTYKLLRRLIDRLNSEEGI